MQAFAVLARRMFGVMERSIVQVGPGDHKFAMIALALVGS